MTGLSSKIPQEKPYGLLTVKRQRSVRSPSEVLHSSCRYVRNKQLDRIKTSNDEPRKAPSDHESGAAEKHSYNNGRFENNDVKSSEIQKNEE